MTDRDPRDPFPALGKVVPPRRISSSEIDWEGVLRIPSRGVVFTGKFVESNYLTLRRQLPVTAGEGGELAFQGAEGYQTWFIDSFEDTLRIRDESGVRFVITPDGLTADAKAWTLGELFWSLGNGSKVGSYVQLGSMVIATGRILLGSSSTVSAGFSTSFPVTPSSFYSHTNRPSVGWVTYHEASASIYQGMLQWSTSTRARFYVHNVSGTYSTLAVASPTIPFTFATNSEIHFTMLYQAA